MSEITGHELSFLPSRHPQWAANFLELLRQVRGRLVSEAKNAEQVAFECDADPEAVYHCLVHLANNGEAQMSMGKTPADDDFQL